MQFLKKGILLGMAFFVMACSKDDTTVKPDPDLIQRTDPKPEPENNAPGSFELLSPEADTEREVLLPIFVWDATTDPDGDTVTYDLFVDMGADPQTTIATGIADTAFVSTEKLKLFATYYWKVVAKDSKGSEKASTIRKFEVHPRWYVTEFNSDDDKTQKFSYNEEGLLTAYILNRNDGGPDRITTYTYDTQGKMIGLSYRNRTDTYKYDNEGRLIRIESEGIDARYEIRYNSGNQIQYIECFDNDEDYVGELSMEYSDAVLLPTGYVFTRKEDKGSGNFEISSIVQATFEWDDKNNLTSYLIEIDRQDGQGYVVSESTKLDYDDYSNPWYAVLEDKMGFDLLSVNNIRGLDTFYFDNLLKWMGVNNIKKRSSDYGIWKEDRVYDYSYNDEGYPVSAEVTINSTYPGADPESVSNYAWNYQP